MIKNVVKYCVEKSSMCFTQQWRAGTIRHGGHVTLHFGKCLGAEGHLKQVVHLHQVNPKSS